METVNVGLNQKSKMTKDFLKKKAVELMGDENLSEFFIEAARFLCDMDYASYSRIVKRALDLRTTESIVAQNMLIERFAEQEAKEEVCGPEARILPEFMLTTQGMVTGEELFKIRKQMHKNKLISERIELMRKIGLVSLKNIDNQAFMKRNNISEEQIFGKTE